MEHSVVRYLKKAAEIFKDKTLYKDRETRISFEELYRKSGSVGTAVAEAQASEKPVAILTGRHIYTPACYLGVAMAGCFYAPMDPAMPESRLKKMLSVIDANLLITDREHRQKAVELGYSGKVLVMEDILDNSPDKELLDNRIEGITDNTPIYVLFTSGSTGAPKGVLTSHRALTCYLEGLQSVIGLDEGDVLGNQSPLDYIAAIRDLYLPLLTGAQTMFISPSEFAMPQRMLEDMAANGITTICWSATGLEIPAKLGAFDEDEAVDPTRLPPLRRVVFSGSVISNPCLRKWQEAFPEAVFINQYGPTEATGSCTYHIIDRLVDDDDVIPVGKAYPNYSIILIDDDGKLCPPGETGEICVRGPATALGYYNAPEQTKASFVKNPTIHQWPEIIYKTGDLGRQDEEGILFFLGRKDRQFKHMGHRIEPEEIEQKALSFGSVEECACLYHKPSQIIHLFYCGDAEKKELTLFFRKELPSFMVPRKITKLKELPHLPNGKIDRRKLQNEVNHIQK